VTTRGIAELKKRGIAFDVLRYRYEHAAHVARAAAEAVGVPSNQTVKSVIFVVDRDAFVFALIDADASVSRRKLGRAVGRKHAEPASPRDAQRITGYLVGGISPLGVKMPLPVVLDETTAAHTELIINAGARGTLVRLKINDLINVTGATIADIRA